MPLVNNSAAKVGLYIIISHLCLSAPQKTSTPTEHFPTERQRLTTLWKNKRRHFHSPHVRYLNGSQLEPGTRDTARVLQSISGGGGRESIRGGARRHKGFTDAILFSCFNILSESLSQRNSITRNKSAILLAKQECTAGNNNSGDYNAQHHSNRCHGNDSQVRFRQ